MEHKAPSVLRQLAQIINNAVDTIEATYRSSNVDLPSLDEPFDIAAPGESLRQDPAVSTAFYISACIRAVSELNVVELLREAGPKAVKKILCEQQKLMFRLQGLHAKDIAAATRSGVDHALLVVARMLRLLATHHIFHEVSPNVFANNRLSSPLDKNKPTSVLFESTEDCFRSSSCLMETIKDPKEGEVPFNRAFSTTVPMYYWIQRPENAYRRQRFGLGMQGTAAAEPSDTIFQGFDWGILPEDSVLVDAGAGIGSSSMMIAKKYPKLHIVLQNLVPTANGARVHWTENLPEHVERNMVEFQGYDFFNPQPVKNAVVFLLRCIIHNWPDLQTIKIFKNLRAVALPHTKLVIVEKILPVASVDQGSEAKEIPGAAHASAQAPLLSNWGSAVAELYFFDIGMHMTLGGTDRTLDGYVDVLRHSGWEIVQVYHCGRSELSHLVAKPV
ncbi:O-methyltransferase [Mycena metata]|uniref:O-methyltransferase n=1 Tax=Mycena metata TaxID=1033252 RepID=A0AAD7N313_9AGAR|nr:O-methyltransferase [Mycena metata]